MSEQTQPLFAEFSLPSYEAWVAATVKSLKGRPFESLVSQTEEGIVIRPFYTAADAPAHAPSPGQPPYRRGAQDAGTLNPPWLIAQRLPCATPEQFNQALLADLRRGQTAVYLDTRQPTVETLADLNAALQGVVLAAAPVFLVGQPAVFSLLAQLLEQTNQSPADLQGGLLYDPLAELANQGRALLEVRYEEVADWVRWAGDHAPEFTTLAVDTAVYHEGGAHAVQELAFALATGVYHIRQLQALGLAISQIASQLRFVFAIGGDFFMEIAKLRAARALWAQVIEGFGGEAQAQKMKIHGETAVRNKSRLDPYVNMLRTTTEAFAAAVGGVDSLLTVPFNQPLSDEPDEFARRIARNQQLILQEEVHLTRFIDPVGGAYYAEWLTDQLAKRAWSLFQEIEAAGGMLAALQAELPQQWVAETAAARAAKLAKRKEVMVGVNQYADVGERLSVSGERYSVSGKQTSESSKQSHVSSLQSAISPIRLSEPFEALRNWASRYEMENGRRPQIFLANMGPLRQYKARADFTRGFFAVGGFEMIDEGGFDSPETAANAALKSEAKAVVICSTDETYPELVSPLVQGIKTQQPGAIVILAGYPKEQIEAHKAAGINAFIHLGADCLATNQWLQTKFK